MKKNSTLKQGKRSDCIIDNSGDLNSNKTALKQLFKKFESLNSGRI